MSDPFYVREIFDSVQGEGTICLGRRQVFVRFCDCNMLCKYCDTDFKRSEFCSVFRQAGSPTVELLENPVSAERLAEVVAEIANPNTHSISLTGGEPLARSTESMRKLCERLRSLGLKTYLETNGTLPTKLDSIRDLVDFVSMDIKPPSATSKGTVFWDKHRDFLEAAKGIPTFVKFVASAENLGEAATAAKLVAEVSPDTDFVIQPETNRLRAFQSASNQWIWEMYRLVSDRLTNVHVIPQTHSFLNLQ